MFERFTEPARQVIVLAQDEARALRHGYIGTEHLLLGLLRLESGLAARVLGSLGVSVEEVRSQVARIVGEGDEAVGGQIPFTPRSEKVPSLQRARQTSRRDRAGRGTGARAWLRPRRAPPLRAIPRPGRRHVRARRGHERGGSLGAEHERIRRGALDRLSQQRGESSERRH